MKTTDRLLGFGLAWPCRRLHVLSCFSLCVSCLCFIPVPPLSLCWSFHVSSFSHIYSVSLCPKTLKHFRIFWSSSVLGWWHGTGVASVSPISVPSVLVQSDSDPCFRMILYKKIYIYETKGQNMPIRVYIPEHKQVDDISSPIQSVWCSSACLHVPTVSSCRNVKRLFPT